MKKKCPQKRSNKSGKRPEEKEKNQTKKFTDRRMDNQEKREKVNVTQTYAL